VDLLPRAHPSTVTPKNAARYFLAFADELRRRHRRHARLDLAAAAKWISIRPPPKA